MEFEVLFCEWACFLHSSSEYIAPINFFKVSDSGVRPLGFEFQAKGRWSQTLWGSGVLKPEKA